MPCLLAKLFGDSIAIPQAGLAFQTLARVNEQNARAYSASEGAQDGARAGAGHSQHNDVAATQGLVQIRGARHGLRERHPRQVLNVLP